MREEIIQIKKDGKLVAISPGCEYWVKDDVLYSVNSSGTNFIIWCSVSRLEKHLHRLYQITGSRFFTNDPTMVIIDKEFISQFSYG